MNAEQDYQLDVAGYLIVRGALTADQVRNANDPLHEQPVLQSYVSQLCGPDHTVDGEAELLAVQDKGPDRLAANGSEPVDWARAYYRQGDARFCQSLIAVWALDDVAEGDGGFILVPASHNALVATPHRLQQGQDDLGIVVQPALQAGDLLLCSGALMYGTRPWRNGARRLAVCSFIRNEVRPADLPTAPEEAWMADLTPAQRAILGAPQRGVVHSDGASCQLQAPDTHYHPSILTPTMEPTIDEEEFFLWDLNGYLVLRDVMDADWVQAACAGIEANRQDLTGGHKPAILSPALAGSPTSSLRGLFELAAPHAEPFRRMIAHPPVVQRLNWMLGGGFTLGHVRAMCYEPGSCGLFMHGSPEPALGRNHYRVQNGRCFCESVNVAWQLVDAGPDDGGFVCIPGSHKSRYPIPERLIGLDDELGLVRRVPARAGDVVFFLGAAQTHGAYPWTGPQDRKVALLNFKSASRA